MQNGPNSGFYSPSQAAQVLSLSKRRVLQLLTSDPPGLVGTKDPRGRWLIARADLFDLQERRDWDQRERPGPKSEQPPATSPELVEVLREQVEDLRARLDVADQRDREQRRIIAALTSRIPELPSAPVEAHEDAPGGPQSPGPTSTLPEPPAGPQTGAQPPQTGTRKPWWRRVLRS